MSERELRLYKRKSLKISENKNIEWDYNKIHAIAAIGNNITKKTYLQYNLKVYSWNNTTHPDTIFIDKDFTIAKNNFLWFGGGDIIRKGLDLVIEIFSKNPEISLWIAGDIKNKKFIDLYYDELFNTPNIYYLGWIEVNSPEFFNVCRKCAFHIFPSCSEGQAGSVIVTTNAGVIPIISRETGMCVEDFGILIQNDSDVEIHNTIELARSLSANELYNLSIRARQITSSKYSREAFTKKWYEILSDFLNNEYN